MNAIQRNIYVSMVQKAYDKYDAAQLQALISRVLLDVTVPHVQIDAYMQALSLKSSDTSFQSFVNSL